MARRQKRRSWKSWRPKGLVALLAVAILAYGLIHWYHKSHDHGVITTADGHQVALNPPTTQEKKAADSQKDQIVQDEKNRANSSNSNQPKKNVSVVITELSASSIKGYVQGVFEEGGTCTATAVQGSQVITKTSTGFQNVSYTQCAPISWGSPLGLGKWTVTLKYQSSTAEGSQSQTLEVK